MADPTGAQMRTINSFWDSPRYAIAELPPLPVAVVPTPTPTATPTETATPTATATPVPLGATAPEQPAVAKPVPPKVSLFVPTEKGRRTSAFLEQGLTFKVTADKPVTDVEVRLFELLPAGLRPLGAAFRVDPGPDGAHLKLEPTAFAKGKLKRRGKRQVRALATVTGRDGLVGRAQADFTLR